MVVAAVIVFTAAGFVMTQRDTVAQAGQPLGYVPAVTTGAGLLLTNHDTVAQAGQELGYAPPTSTPSTLPTPSPAPVPLKLPDTKGRSLDVSIVGDSLTVGLYASGPTTRNRNLILSVLRRRGPVSATEAFASGAAGGSTAVTVPGRLDLVVLELGTADEGRVTAGAFVVSYAALVKQVRRTSPTADLVCAGTWGPANVVFDAVIEQACEAAGGRFVSLRSLYLNPANRGPAKVMGFYGLSDDIAPNNAGHKAIAKAVLEAIGLRP